MVDQHSARIEADELSVELGHGRCEPPARPRGGHEREDGARAAHFRVADVTVGEPDARGEPVDRIFFRRRHYAIYSCKGQVTVQYSDDEAEASEQIGWTADLIPLRDKLQYMIKGKQVPGCYERHIADSMRLGLENKAIVAKEILEGAVQDVLGYKGRVGRTVYLGFAGPLAFGASAVLIALSFAAIYYGEIATGLLLLAAGGGAMGALLSIAIALRKRTVAVDDDRKANMVDGTIRLLIGIISAAALFLVLNAGLVANIGTEAMRSANPNLEAAWQTALIIGFAAGFFERLVPDLLEKTFEQQAQTTAAPPSK